MTEPNVVIVWSMREKERCKGLKRGRGRDGRGGQGMGKGGQKERKGKREERKRERG